MPAPLHISVLANEVLAALAPQNGQIIVDGTLGGGGHTRLLATAVAPDGLVLAMDRDIAAIDSAAVRLRGMGVKLLHGNFCKLPEALQEFGLSQVDSVLLDLGLSSDQLADAERGFSYQVDGPLDMRFDTGRGEPAWCLLDRLSEKHLADLIYQYGEERFSRRIARRIIETRRQHPIRTSRELAELVRGCVPRPKKRQRIDAATRTFQALRIAVNEELLSLDRALERYPELIRCGGLLAIISFHSLEDRRVKLAFRHSDRYEPVTRKPIVATEAEVQANPRCRSARLRVARIV